MNNQPLRRHTLPRLDIKTGFNHSPHVVILGAGASRACCPLGDRNGRKLPLMNDFVEGVGITDIIHRSGHNPVENFEKVYSEIHQTGNTAILDELDKAIRDYFSRLLLPDIPTLYDCLLLSLRPKDMIVTFNWDPMLPQTYKRWRHLGAVLPEIIFLHGNIDIGIDGKKKVCGFMSDDHRLTPTRLLYPVEQKNYASDVFIASQWTRAKDYLAGAYQVTVYGYSAPTTDIEAKALLLEAWLNNSSRDLAAIYIVDIRPPSEVMASWSDFIVRDHGAASTDFSHNLLMRHPRRSCESFAFATLQNDPWKEDPMPTFRSLAELDAWIKPLIEEEASGKLAGIPLH
jgi:hypothetical protein